MILLDSNVVIDAGKAEFADHLEWIYSVDRSVSVASNVEVLGYHRLDEPT